LKTKTVEKYKNQSRESGVSAYETGADYIIVEFIGGDTYRYTYHSAGKRAIEMMKKLAVEGKGLSTYISQKIRQRYEKRL
jgi:hypothetical protein